MLLFTNGSTTAEQSAPAQSAAPSGQDSTAEWTTTIARRRMTLANLLFVFAFKFIDRQILAILADPTRRDPEQRRNVRSRAI